MTYSKSWKVRDVLIEIFKKQNTVSKIAMDKNLRIKFASIAIYSRPWKRNKLKYDMENGIYVLWKYPQESGIFLPVVWEFNSI